MDSAVVHLFSPYRLSAFLLSLLQSFQLIYNIHKKLPTSSEEKTWLKSLLKSPIDSHLMKELIKMDVFTREQTENETL